MSFACLKYIQFYARHMNILL